MQCYFRKSWARVASAVEIVHYVKTKYLPALYDALAVCPKFCRFNMSLSLTFALEKNISREIRRNDARIAFGFSPAGDVINTRKRKFVVNCGVSDNLLCQICVKVL